MASRDRDTHPWSQAFEVSIHGELSDALVEELGAVRSEPRTTVLVATVDRAHLHSIIQRVEDLGLSLLSIHEVSAEGVQPERKPAS